ncbi:MULTISPECIES: IucA/IucC family protein [unclassified Microbulbifer]|uniref:IucA/IucC family protein n=1 Tax=unclassified Microbulbifer TaxID=2619833 RepID=UPI0027E4DF6E|nr:MULTISPECIES: IucA/IucC family protein [unclassified Microbulbifer]
MATGLNEEIVERQSAPTVEKATAAERILRELVDALIQENLFHLQDRARLIDDSGAYSEVDDFALAVGECYFSYPLNGGADQLLFRARRQRRVQPYRLSRLPVLLLQSQEDGAVALDAANLMQCLAGAAEREDLPDLGGMDRFMHDLAVAEAQTEWALENIPAALTAVERKDADLPAWERLGALRDRPFHPLARAKTGWSLEEFRRYGAESGDTFGLAWVALRNESLVGSPDLRGTAVAEALLEAEELQALRQAAAARGFDGDDFTLVPVHPWQLRRLAAEFASEFSNGDWVLISESLGGFTPTSSVRSLAPAAKSGSVHVKLPLAIAALGAQRILPPRYLHNGAAAQQLLESVIGREPALQGKFFCCDERQWLAFAPAGETMFSNRTGHLSCLLRRYPRMESPQCRLLPMSAFTLAEGDRVPAFETLLRDGGETPEKFFRSLCDHLCALCFTCFSYGLMPEVHGQNLLLVIEKGRICGLVLRDHDTLRFFPPWVHQSGIEAPRYLMDWSTPNSLVCLSPQELLRYFQTLGVQVNLHAIADTLSSAYGVDAEVFWEIIKTSCHRQLQQLELPDFAKALLRRELLDNPRWPTRLLLTPYLMRRTRETGMPAGLGETRNPLMDSV